jgi:putative ABC transport system substrate-binding protein
MNKLLGTVLTSALTISLLAGCGTSTSNKKKVGIIQFMDHTSLNEIKDSFDKEMKTLGYDDKNIEYTFKNGQGDTNTCASIANDFAGKNFDCVMAIATPAAQAVAKLATKTPVVFSAVTDPVGAQLTSSLSKPDKNITGTSDEVQVDQIIDKALEINPNTKTIGMLYNKGEANSVTNIKKAKAYCAKKNIKVEEATIASVNEAQSAVNVLNSKCDAIFAPNDNTVASAALFNPIKWGVDVVVHSTSKYTNGQGTTIGGIIVERDGLAEFFKANENRFRKASIFGISHLSGL